MGSGSTKEEPQQDAEPISYEVKQKVPELVGESNLMSSEDVEFFSKHMPTSDYLEKCKTNGKSFTRFLKHVVEQGPTIIIIKDQEGNIFGGFASEDWKKSPKFYGNSYSFLFSLTPSRERYRPTGDDKNYQYLNHGTETMFNGIGMGGQQDFFAWCLDDWLDKGHSRGNPSSTYNNPPLASKGDFIVDSVEVWQIIEPEVDSDEEYIKSLTKNTKKSVINDEDNPDKVLQGMMGHEFSSYHKAPPLEEDKDDSSGSEKKKKDTSPWSHPI